MASACLPAELVDGGIDAVAADGNRGVGRLIAQGVAQIAAQFEDFIGTVKGTLPGGILGIERRPRAPVRGGLAVETCVGGEQQLLADSGKYRFVQKTGSGEAFEVGDNARVVKSQGWHGCFALYLADSCGGFLLERLVIATMILFESGKPQPRHSPDVGGCFFCSQFPFYQGVMRQSLLGFGVPNKRTAAAQDVQQYVLFCPRLRIFHARLIA